MKVNIAKVLLGGLIFITVQRILSVISITCIKPNIPENLGDDRKEAMQTALEAVILIMTILVLKKLN
jgi:hypothetical protein